MTHNIHPYSQRLGIIRDWKSRWFKVGDDYRTSLHTDLAIRKFLEKELHKMYVSTIDIERNKKTVRIIIKTSRPGFVIGRNGENMNKIRAGLTKALRKANLLPEQEIKLDVVEVKNPDADAAIVAQMIAEGLERRMPFRRVLKGTAEKVMAAREVLGVRVRVAGRLGGAEMARSEQIRKGQVPLQTLRADVDYAERRAMIPQGVVGIKVWIYKGEIFDK